MKPLRRQFSALILGCSVAIALSALAAAQSSPDSSQPPVGLGFLVQDTFGGQIFGYDVDHDGTLGLFSEIAYLPDGNLRNATETFNPSTGAVIAVVEELTETQDNLVTLGILGLHTGLRQWQHVQNGYVVSRTYGRMSPVQGNKFNGMWLPPIDNSKELFEDIEGDPGHPGAVVMASSFQCCSREVFGTTVATNLGGPIIQLQDPIFTQGVPPLLAYDGVHNQAVLAQAQGAPYSTPEIMLIDLTTRAITEFTGLGDGFVNGLAVDSSTGIACTATETDNSAEFYNLATKTGIIVSLPVIGKYSGSSVAVDSLHKLFLIAHPRPAQVGQIHVYDENGNLQESIDGFALPPGGVKLALVPSKRLGFVQAANGVGSALQSFTY